MKTPKVWDIMKKFKELCKFRGWKTSESEDWVEIDDQYHNFLLTRSIHPSSFKNIVTNRKCVIREGLFYRVVKANYTAWLFSETPPENLVNMVFENPDFSKRIAIYDLSPFLEGKNLCIRMNYTDSPVFHEFENFLRKELGIKFKHYSTQGPKLENSPITEMA
ncbi:MAG: hypothetical protein QXU21_04835 [Candidatus Bathyarchaeia archaeon]